MPRCRREPGFRALADSLGLVSMSTDGRAHGGEKSGGKMSLLE
jgi:hypothetical protein